MSGLKMTGSADLGVIYEADKIRYAPEVWLKMGIGKDQFIAFYRDFPSVGYEMDGVPIGGAIFYNKEIHLTVLPQYHGRWAWLWKPTLDWAFALCNPIQVSIEKFNIKCLRFMDDSGWPRVNENEDFVTFEMSAETNQIFRKSAIRKAKST